MDHQQCAAIRHQKLHYRVGFCAALLLLSACNPVDKETPPPEVSIVTNDTATPEAEHDRTPAPSSLRVYSPGFAHSIVPLWSTFIIADGGDIAYGSGDVMEIRETGEIVWGPMAFSWVHSARPNSDTTDILVSETGKNRVLVIDRTGVIAWNSDFVSPFSDGSVLKYPNDARWHDSGFLITDRDNHRVVLISISGQVLWQHGETGVSGNDDAHLKGPHNGKILSNGNLLVCDSGNDRVVEINQDDRIIWSFSDMLAWPRDASELKNGNILISSSQSGDVLEVTRSGDVAWSVSGIDLPYTAERLPDGLTLVTARDAVLWIDASGKVVKQITNDDKEE